MTILDMFTQIVRAIWNGMASITVPVLNISATSLLLGVFIVCVAIQILNPLLGIGASIVDSFVVGAHNDRARTTARYNAKVSRQRAQAKADDRAVRDVKRWV